MTILKPLTEEKTEHLMWFVEHGFHQMKDHRQAAKKELEARGVNIRGLKHVCLCNECELKRQQHD